MTHLRRPGFAVAAALCMVAAVAGVAAASFYTVVEGRRAANRGARLEQAAGAADAGLRWVIDSWDVARRDSLPIGAADSGSARGDSTPTRVYVIRLGSHLYWLAAVGQAGNGSSVEADRAHHLLVEVLRPAVSARAALTSGGSVVAGRSVAIRGDDSPPPEWTDCPPADTASAPAVVLPDGVPARYDDGDAIPATRFDSSAANPRTYTVLGRIDVAALAARADISIVPGAILSPAPDMAADCRSSPRAPALGSWGEPARAGPREAGGSAGCERYFPVIHAAGDLGVAGGRGQGILIVQGRLRIQGPFVFAGIILASGGIEVTGQDVTVYGAVLSAAAGGVTWRASGELRRSTCAVARASDAAARPYPVPHRGWAELF
jgi:hypothetical protein